MDGDEEIVCKTFFDTVGHKSQMVRIAQRLNALEFVEQSDTEKLPTFKEMSTRQRSIVK
jgi:alpha-D-ribose 1-methylphosphonate 5-triphosphate synthase subunit PhnL